MKKYLDQLISIAIQKFSRKDMPRRVEIEKSSKYSFQEPSIVQIGADHQVSESGLPVSADGFSVSNSGIILVDGSGMNDLGLGERIKKWAQNQLSSGNIERKQYLENERVRGLVLEAHIVNENLSINCEDGMIFVLRQSKGGEITPELVYLNYESKSDRPFVIATYNQADVSSPNIEVAQPGSGTDLYRQAQVPISNENGQIILVSLATDGYVAEILSTTNFNLDVSTGPEQIVDIFNRIITSEAMGIADMLSTGIDLQEALSRLTMIDNVMYGAGTALADDITNVRMPLGSTKKEKTR